MHTTTISDRDFDKGKTIEVSNVNYIEFVLNENHYYFQTDDNPFFPFYYSKTPMCGNKYSYDAVLDETKKDWLFDCLWQSSIEENVIIEAADILFNILISAECTPINRDYKKERVPNTYDGGTHIEKILVPERIKEADWL